MANYTIKPLPAAAEGDPWDADLGDPWDDDLPKSTFKIKPLPQDLPLSDRIVSGVKKNFAALGNTLDTAAFLPSAGIAKLAGIDPTPLFKEMNERERLRNQWAGDVDPGFAFTSSRVVGLSYTVPLSPIALALADLTCLALIVSGLRGF